MSDVCPDVMGRDLCDGGSLRREARHADPGPMPSVSEASQREREPVPSVREPAPGSGGSVDASPIPRHIDCPKYETLSDRALALVDGPRQDDYASPQVNLKRIGGMWAAVLGLEDEIPPATVALMMAALKIARAAHKPTDDSIVDTVGYMELAWRLR